MVISLVAKAVVRVKPWTSTVGLSINVCAVSHFARPVNVIGVLKLYDAASVFT